MTPGAKKEKKGIIKALQNELMKCAKQKSTKLCAVVESCVTTFGFH